MLIPDDVKLFLYTPPTDMRKSIDTLCMLVSNILKMTPTDGYLFLFRNRGGNKLKILYYETNCFTLWYRRLERGKFVFPKNAEGHIELDKRHFEWLLARVKRRPKPFDTLNRPRFIEKAKLERKLERLILRNAAA